MIDAVSYILLILVVLGLANGLPGLGTSLGARLFWITAPGILLLFITNVTALLFAAFAIAANIAVLCICNRIDNPRLSARAPYLVLLLLFVPDVFNELRGAPVLFLGSAFFIIRQMMTTAQAIKKKILFSDYLPALLAASFFFAALPSGPVFNGLDVMKDLKKRNLPQFGEGYYRIFEGFVFLFAISGFMSMGVEHIRMLEHGFAQHGNTLAYAGLHFVLLPLFSFGFLFGTFYGYSRTAEGVALVLGFSVPQNFDKPHLARDLGDYWKRWHRSMADFVMQYIYLPIMVTWANAKVALISAFVFMGLWHDFSPNFLIWGLGHGVGLAYGMPWAKRNGFPPLAIRVVSLTYVVSLSSVAHRVWF
ncbi:MBOAT family O-acyltransferase [Seohaeicola saemankumensis]|uniref:MBOAT family O-acyltransferase n=1 Tax=Seohaeicola saemankumensis TaxID=481181 RepID=A0ABW3TGP2_9RHOB